MEPRPILQEELLKFWYDAAREEHGLFIPVPSAEDGKWLMDKMYEARKDLPDPKINSLKIHVSKDGLEVSIYKSHDAVLG